MNNVTTPKTIKYYIYGIKINNEIKYVGQTTNYKARVSTHKYRLKNNKHKSYLLQEYFNIYCNDINKVEFVILMENETFDESLVNIMEALIMTDHKDTILNSIKYDVSTTINVEYNRRTPTSSTKHQFSNIMNELRELYVASLLYDSDLENEITETMYINDIINDEEYCKRLSEQ